MADESKVERETHTFSTDEEPVYPTKPTSGYDYASSNPRRSFCIFFTILLLLIAATALVLWLVYRPQKPQFKVIGAAVYGFNASAPPLISASVQFSVITRNPNKRTSIYYDEIRVFVTYRDQQITQPVTLPPFYHRKHSTVAFSPLMGGEAVPMTAEAVNGLVVDQAYGIVMMRMVLKGRMRWKAGAIKTGHRDFDVSCDVVIALKKGVVGQVPLLDNPPCKVDM